MSGQAVPKTDRAAGVRPAAPWRVQSVSVLPEYRLAVAFRDGTTGTVDLSGVTTSPAPGMYAALADPAVFAQASVELGVVVWPNGADLDPAWMHERLRAERTWTVPV